MHLKLSSFEKCMHSKLTYFLYHNLTLFLEKMFYQNHSLALHTVKIFFNLTLSNHWTWD